MREFQTDFIVDSYEIVENILQCICPPFILLLDMSIPILILNCLRWIPPNLEKVFIFLDSYTSRQTSVTVFVSNSVVIYLKSITVGYLT